MRNSTTYDLVFLADNEWGNQIMREVAHEWFHNHPECNFVQVYEHAGWWLAFSRQEMECIGTANDEAVLRADRPRPSAYSGLSTRREVQRPDINEITSLTTYTQPLPLAADTMRAPHPIVRQIVDRCHVGESHLSVIRYVCSRLANGRKTFLAMKRGKRRTLMRDAIRVHDRNRKLYRQVMRGF